MKRLILWQFLLLIPSISYATDDSQTAVLLQHDKLSVKSQEIKSSSVGFVHQSSDTMAVGIYTEHEFDRNLLFDYPDHYKSIDLLLDTKEGHYQYLGIFRSESNEPVAGGLHTYESAFAMGIEMASDPRWSVVLGGGLAVGDFGIDQSNGKPWPVIPLPLVRIKQESNFIESKFEFLTSPNISFILQPKNRIRLFADLRMDQLRDERDLIYELGLTYFPFWGTNSGRDFASFIVGVKNDGIGEFTIASGNGDETLEVHYRSVFLTLDLALLKITAGYAFDGRELYRGEIKKQLQSGSFLSLSLAAPF